MKIKSYLWMSSLALLAVGCQDDSEVTTVNPTPGEAVAFGASLETGDASKRTVYGTENETAFPIYWVDGDQVLITSPQCSNPTATYSVKAATTTQNYADGLLAKTGEIGVRWGDSETADFYSVYPASQAAVSNESTVTLTMPAVQDGSIDDGNATFSPDMDACLMYAATKGAANGTTVDLKYKPLATALRFTLQGPTSGSVQVNRIVLNAPVNIAGTFSSDLSSANGTSLPTVSSLAGTSSVTVNATYGNGSYMKLNAGDKVEMNFFFLLTVETQISGDWSIQIVTPGQTFTKKLAGSSTSERGMTLVPGKIHRLAQLLPTLDVTAEWDPSNWMVNIPRNVYLSEISIPGSWNSLNSDSQGKNPTIDAQYQAGVRAFHLDARWQGRSTLGAGVTAIPNNVTALGIANGGDEYTVYPPILGSPDLFKPALGRIMSNSSTPTFASQLEKVSQHLKADEYMIVMCTFAQGSYDHDRENGGWEKAISDAVAALPEGNVLDARTVNENTTVADALGKILVIINTPNPAITDSKCMFMNYGMSLVESEWTAATSNKPASYNIDLVGGGANLGLKCYSTHAQVTANADLEAFTTSDGRGYAPTVAMRQTMAGSILDWSQENYANIDSYGHNEWIYLGFGGYYVNNNDSDLGGHDVLGATFANWIDNRITAMESTSYYPVGLVFLNYAAMKHASTCKNILELNNKYRKAYDPNRSPIDGKPITSTTSHVNMQQVSTVTNGGNAISY